MRYLFLIPVLMVAVVTQASAQSTMDSILSMVATNNKSILVGQQYAETQKLGFKTGIAPSDPVFEYDYLFGYPSTAGNQTDLAITQAFDFPTVYAKKKQLSGQQSQQVDLVVDARRQNVLLDAKTVCIQLIYLNKLQVHLLSRQDDLGKLAAGFQTRLDKGEGNILDLNKAKLQLIEADKAVHANLSLIKQLNHRLTELNGGQSVWFADTLYPALSLVMPFEQLLAEIEAADPMRQYLEQEMLVSQKQLELSKALWLPKLEAGYHYQAILGQRFNGVHAGISIPLWERKGTVKVQRSQIMLTDMQLQEHGTGHYHEVKRLYEQYEYLGQTLQRYREVMDEIQSKPLLDKSLAYGQISTIEYFMELGYYYNTLNGYLETERDYYLVLAALNKHTL